MIDDDQIMLLLVINNGYRLCFIIMNSTPSTVKSTCWYTTYIMGSTSSSFFRCQDLVESDSVMHYYINVLI
jgi:hypothetical protein